jgi:hypothetical protein
VEASLAVADGKALDRQLAKEHADAYSKASVPPGGSP